MLPILIGVIGPLRIAAAKWAAMGDENGGAWEGNNEFIQLSNNFLGEGGVLMMIWQ